MRPLRFRDGNRPLVTALLIGLLGANGGAERARAGNEQKNLQLEVTINNVRANMISSFILLPDGRMAATRNELEELGLRIDAAKRPTDVVLLDELPTVTYKYDEPRQRIAITVDNAQRLGRSFDLRPSEITKAANRSDWGTVLNYNLLASSGNLSLVQPLSFGGASLTLNSRMFSPYGTFEQSQIIQATTLNQTNFVRLDTAYRYSDQERMITYRAGDAISGGLTWTRPVRLGGLQAQSNFALRPDLITMPLPNLGGTAALPSTVDVYVNNMKTFTQEIGAGPFTLNNVPLMSGAGNAQLVIRDSSGQETRTTVPFYATASLLAPGLTSWSVEAGFPRVSYGSTLDTYVQTPVGSATVRRGMTDMLTLEGHVEGGAGLIQGGFGATTKLGTLGVLNAALSASSYSQNFGGQGYLSIETQFGSLLLNASTQRSFGEYADLAAVTARLQNLTNTSIQSWLGLFSFMPVTSPSASGITPIFVNFAPPRAIDRVSLSTPLPFDRKASLVTSLIHSIDGGGLESAILTTTYTRALPYRASLFATTYHDFNAQLGTGVMIGVSMPLGDSASLATSVAKGPGGTVGSLEATKPLAPEIGSYGWRVRDNEGAATYREAALSYRANAFTTQMTASSDVNGARGIMELRGAIATLDRDIFLTNWVDDSFAVVKTGMPGVKVLHENRPIGQTDNAGVLLVPSLRSYQRNKISIDVTNMPVDTQVETTREFIAPADQSGVLVNFHGRRDVESALVVFVQPNGDFVPAGSIGRANEGDEFVIGYDGQAFIKNLRAANTAVLETRDGNCRATFDFAPKPGEQVRIGPVACISGGEVSAEAARPPAPVAAGTNSGPIALSARTTPGQPLRIAIADPTAEPPIDSSARPTLVRTNNLSAQRPGKPRTRHANASCIYAAENVDVWRWLQSTNASTLRRCDIMP